MFVSGEVYGYEIENAAGEIADSCYGFFGFDYAKSQAKEAVDDMH